VLTFANPLPSIVRYLICWRITERKKRWSFLRQKNTAWRGWQLGVWIHCFWCNEFFLLIL